MTPKTFTALFTDSIVYLVVNVPSEDPNAPTSGAAMADWKADVYTAPAIELEISKRPRGAALFLPYDGPQFNIILLLANLTSEQYITQHSQVKQKLLLEKAK